MLIRSQDKLVIIPLNDFTITVDTEEYADNRERNICVCKSESIFEIGHYSTKEKAIWKQGTKEELSNGITPAKARESGHNRRISDYGIKDLTAIYPQYPRGLWKMYLRKRR